MEVDMSTVTVKRPPLQEVGGSQKRVRIMAENEEALVAKDRKLTDSILRCIEQLRECKRVRAITCRKLYAVNDKGQVYMKNLSDSPDGLRRGLLTESLEKIAEEGFIRLQETSDKLRAELRGVKAELKQLNMGPAELDSI